MASKSAENSGFAVKFDAIPKGEWPLAYASLAGAPASALTT
ncbi:hypothetical protein [Hyphomicrobium sp. D-2]|nr:hypothetical protein [Hyphomicrobium sp. D-2]MDH4983346.1 hypothetical protein [Hyphomicrobium sp. D-2]